MKKLPARISKRHTGESARESVLRILKLRGEATAEELSKAMKITYTAVRRHLSNLLQQGLIDSRSVQHGPGRPIYKYRLTDAAVTNFPTGYENLAASMLDTIFQESGHTAVMDFLRLNNSHLIKMLSPRFNNKTLAERVAEMARYFTENGYMSDFTPLPDGNFFLYHQNCAVYKLAVRYRQFCILEPRLIESLLGFKVSRQQYILKNQPICGYLVDSKRPLPPGSSAL